MAETGSNPSVTASLYADVNNFLKLSDPELFALNPDEVEKIQLHHLRRSFADLRTKISALDRLASDVEVNAIDRLEDVIPLCFPHTMYKSYSVTDIENRRFDRMTKWLGTLTTLDLHKLDMSQCTTLDSWLGIIEANTPMRPITSSGTSGKISIFPRTIVEEEGPFFKSSVGLLSECTEDAPVDVRSGQIPILFPWPYDKGRHNIPIMFKVLRKLLYKGNEDMVITLGKDTVTTDEMWLSGRLRRAEARGEQLTLSPWEQEIAARVGARAKRASELWGDYLERALTEFKGKQVILWAPWFQIYQLATYAKERGRKVDWAPDSLIVTGGGTKGHTYPDGWRDVIDEMMPFKYPNRYREQYAFTECTAHTVMCSQRRYHPRPWGIPYVIDPDTSEALPRTGVQTGRCVYFDLMPTTYWGGTITGDEVTVNWDGGCECGRKGPYFHYDIRRFTESRGGDDKITCAKTADAYERLVEFATETAGL